jgi:hypothetical protein
MEESVTLEQEMKAALDGNFWFFTYDWKIECRKVSIGHIPTFEPHKYRKSEAARGGRNSVAAARNNRKRWSYQESEWLKENYKRMSIGACARELDFPYTTVYKKVTALRWKEYDEEMKL